MPETPPHSELRPILDFLWYGYVPSSAVAAEKFVHYRNLLDDDRVETFERGKAKSAKQLLCRIVAENTWQQGMREIRLGVSAGYDSRGLLGAALEVFPAGAVTAYTFGQKGTVDFELARSYTKDVLPRHVMIDIVAQEWSTEAALAQVASRPPGIALALGELLGLRYGSAFKEILPLPSMNGFLGDAVTGKKLPPLVSGRWLDALDMFARSGRTFKGSFSITPKGYDPTAALPADCFPDAGRMLLDDQIQFPVRQEQRIRYSFDNPGNRRVQPYDDPRWVRSFLLLPVGERIGQSFYKRFLARSFPKIFPDLADWRDGGPAAAAPAAAPAAPEAEPRGLASALRRLYRRVAPEPAAPTAPSKMHVEFDQVFHTNPSFRAFCREHLLDLDRRALLPWLDLRALLEEAEAERLTGFGRNFFGLASLEINLKAGRLVAP